MPWARWLQLCIPLTVSYLLIVSRCGRYLEQACLLVTAGLGLPVARCHYIFVVITCAVPVKIEVESTLASSHLSSPGDGLFFPALLSAYVVISADS